MDHDRRRRDSKRLLILILLALVYSVLLSCRCATTGQETLDGAIGVILGLYVCSHPAANAVDRWLFGHSIQRQTLSTRAETWWLALNILALLVGWYVIFIGVTRFTANTT